MTETDKRRISLLNLIMIDMEEDAKKFDGKPLNGRTVAEIHGTLAATIAALANIIKTHIEEHHE